MKLIILLILLLDIPYSLASALIDIQQTIMANQQQIELSFDDVVSPPTVFVEGDDLVLDLFEVNNFSGKEQYTFFNGLVQQITLDVTKPRLRLILHSGGKYHYQLNFLSKRIKIGLSRDFIKLKPTKKLVSSQLVTNKIKLPLLNNANKSDRISFNFQNIDIRALLQLLADFSGYNILVSDSVTGTLSLKLNDVPWFQALDTILVSKSLAMRNAGNIIHIAPIAELSALNKEQREEQKAQEEIESLDTVTVRLKYAQANNIQSIIQASQQTIASPLVNKGSSLQKNEPRSLLSARGTILIDARTNTVIINDSLAHLQDIKGLIDKIDIPVKQVLIDARIVEANSSFEKDLGTRLLLAGVAGNLIVANSVENAAIIKSQLVNPGNNATKAAIDPHLFVNQDFGITNGAALSTVFAPNSSTLIGLEVDALELQSQGRTISRPKIMTASYQAANIQQGVQIPYQQASSAGNTNVAFVNATLSLQVTPQITEDGYILLNVSIQKDSPSSTLQVQGTPAIDTNSITTQVRIKNGSTILVGGVYIDDQQKIQEQVPVLGDIPYLGWLFKSQQTRNNKKELLIFITPHIMANSLDDDS